MLYFVCVSIVLFSSQLYDGLCTLYILYPIKEKKNCIYCIPSKCEDVSAEESLIVPCCC
ncbi:hypothetical protein GLYMA_04G041150v4 [Glycine max]|nr:hypothetical protein GLYMA_04G041150v4 [Glycine max]KAH1109692.1 hypothetical protein GYH30_008880 [Glycine max]